MRGDFSKKSQQELDSRVAWNPKGEGHPYFEGWPHVLPGPNHSYLCHPSLSPVDIGDGEGMDQDRVLQEDPGAPYDLQDSKALHSRGSATDSKIF